MNSISNAAKTYRVSNSYIFQLGWAKYSSATASPEGSIKIPNRIPRGPTDILKALEKTVSYDLTGPSYKFYDDPNLAPYNDRQARMYSLARNAGRKAAKWVRDEHPELFTQVISDPPVMSYMPPAPINEETVNETVLFEKISTIKVTDAIKVYEIMKEKNMDIPQDIKMSLLELLCFYNCEDPMPMELEAERYHGQKPTRRDYAVNSWQNHPVVNSLFSELQHLGSAPYSALLCGMFSAGAKAEGDQLLQEAKDKNIKLDVNVYNAMILRTISVYDRGDVKLNMIMDILKEMNSEGVMPNLGTLNAVFDSVSRLMIKEKYNTLLKLLAEFNKIGIKPSPGTYGLLARGLVGKTRPDSSLQPFVRSILKSLKGQSLEPRHSSDVLFFDWMMKACVVCGSLPLAINCLELFLHSRNRMLADGYKTSSFYNNFFQVLSAKGDYDSLVKYYKLLVPHAHTASPQFYTVLFEACDQNASIKEFPEFWKHYLGTGAFNEETIYKMLEVAINLSGLPDPEAYEVRPVLGELAHSFATFKMDSQRDRVFESVPLTAEMCNQLLTLLARGCKWRTIQTSLNFMTEKNMLPEENVISDIVDNCYDHNNPNMAVWVLKYCQSTFGAKLALHPIAAKLMKSDFLSQDLKGDLKEQFKDDDNYSSSSTSGSSSDSDSSDSDSDDDSSGSEDISIPRKKKPEVPKPDITKVIKPS